MRMRLSKLKGGDFFTYKGNGCLYMVIPDFAIPLYLNVSLNYRCLFEQDPMITKVEIDFVRRK